MKPSLSLHGMWLLPLYTTKMANCFKWDMKKNLLRASDLSTLSLIPQHMGSWAYQQPDGPESRNRLFIRGSILWPWILAGELKEYKEMTASIVCCTTGIQSGILQESMTTDPWRAAENWCFLLLTSAKSRAPFNIQIIISNIDFDIFQVSLDRNSYSN